MNLGFGGFNNSSNNGPAPLNLQKGDLLDLTKAAPTLKHVVVAAGWDVNKKGGDNFDLDISAFLLAKNGRLKNVTTQVVYFRQMMQQGIYLEGDNLTGSGDGDDERINVSLDEIPADIESIVFNVNIYDCVAKRQTFGMVDNSYIRLLDADNDDRELARFELKRVAASATAMTFARLFRQNGGWTFEALGEALTVQDLNQLLLRYYDN